MAKQKITAEPRAMIGDVPVFCAFDELVPIGKVICNPRNPNTHPKEQIKILATIIRGQGWRAPITVSRRSGYIVKGHGRMAAAQSLGLDLVPVDYQNYTTEAEEWADLIADNRVAEMAEIDNIMLKDLLQDLDAGTIDMILTGYDETTLEKLMTQVPPLDLNDKGKNGTGNNKKKYHCPNCGCEFEE
jgi:ParB-like chromosome segregation protein Spo0J